MLPLQYPSCRIEDCTGIYGEDSVSEELDDFTKQFRAAAVEQKSNGLTSLFFSQRAARSGVNEDLGLSLKKSLRDEDHRLARHGVRSFPPTRLCLPFQQ